MQILSDTTQAARKRHRCDSCGRHIEIGEQYARQRIVDGGDAWVFKAHTHCMEAGKLLFNNGLGGVDDTILNVSDMDKEDREAVFKLRPDLYRAIWPNHPEPTLSN